MLDSEVQLGLTAPLPDRRISSARRIAGSAGSPSWTDASRAHMSSASGDEPRKRPRLESVGGSRSPAKLWSALSRSAHPTIQSSRSIYKFERLNHIQEGSYGIVFRARARALDSDAGPSAAGVPEGTVVAVKKLKLEQEKFGFPITSLREIHTLFLSRPHPSVVGLHEVCVGNTLDQIFLVMEFVEHDLKTVLTLLDETKTRFLPSEIKAMMHQLLSAVKHLHSNWIVHRDLKTSNLLLNNRGRLKIADFGLARRFGDPIGGWDPETALRGAKADAKSAGMTDLVVTLWYRAPELLLLEPSGRRARDVPAEAPLYDEKIDMWSIGCIFCELILGRPLFTGSREDEQIAQIAALLGPPTPALWPSVVLYPGYMPPSRSSASKLSTHEAEARVKHNLRKLLEKEGATEGTIDLIFSLLHYDPSQRLSAAQSLQHEYFKQRPNMAHPDTFPTFPSAAAGEKRAPTHVHNTPSIPKRGPPGPDAKMEEKYPMEFGL